MINQEILKEFKEKSLPYLMKEHTSQGVYSAFEKYLCINDFDIIHSFRDTRGNDGDDGGYMIILSTKDNKYHIHIHYVNYNGNYTNGIEEEDYESFNTLEECRQWLQQFTEDLDLLCDAIPDLEDSHKYYSDTYEIEELVKVAADLPFSNKSLKYLNFINSCKQPYNEFYEYPQYGGNTDRAGILTICYQDDTEYWKLQKQVYKDQWNLMNNSKKLLEYKINNSQYLSFDEHYSFEDRVLNILELYKNNQVNDEIELDEKYSKEPLDKTLRKLFWLYDTIWTC